MTVEQEDDNIWLDTKDLEKRVPPALRNTNTGLWWSNAEEFSLWARNFLLQEIRINILVRYLDHKKKHPGPKMTEEIAAMWGGYGGYV